MITLYLKQAWALLKQNPLFSGLYIAGTGLAIAMTMIVAVIYYIKVAPVYPELERMQTLYLTSASFQKGTEQNKQTYQWAVSYQALQEWFYPLKNVEFVSATMYNMADDNYIQPDDRSGDFTVKLKLVDPHFFQIYSFRFVEGKAFTASDFESGICTAVVTEELARRLYGTAEGVVGRSFSLDYVNYRVCGVVHSASYLTSDSYAQVYVPYSVVPKYRDSNYGIPYLGGFKVTFLVKDPAQAEALHAEIQEIVRKENLIHAGEWQVNLWEQPTSHLQRLFKPYPSMTTGAWAQIRYLLLILLVLLLVPALNLSGMIASRMESRLSEMGVRKSFGAGRGGLLSQVMWENLLLTLLGGILGLLLAWLVLYTCREWVFMILEDWAEPVPEGVNVLVSGEVLFAPAVFAVALLFCITLNLLSALIPAWHALRKPIVYSLNEKR